ncbi:MAG TPA: methyltransferase domain-containing protein [Marmoricola sp.]|nr:methyltransferase domain-containing protein [Marmoricola sp.]
MSFDVGAGEYGRFMGRFSEPLGFLFAHDAELEPGQRALDVGCGAGALTARLVERLGVEQVAAVDPSERFVAAVRERFPGLDVQSGSAEALPFPDDAFDASLAQLVVQFMSDPVAGLREMARVTRPGGRVAACVWDMAGGINPLATFWAAARDVDPMVIDESRLPGVRREHLIELAEAAGLSHITAPALALRVPFTSFEEWWEPYTFGVGPAGSYLAGLDDEHRIALRDRCAALLPPGPFEVVAQAWSIQATVM